MSDAFSHSWQSIETAPVLERVMVCGWQPRHRTCAGYWWWGEDCVGDDGVGIEHPDAMFWTPIVLPPFPADIAPKGEA